MSDDEAVDHVARSLIAFPVALKAYIRERARIVRELAKLEAVELAARDVEKRAQLSFSMDRRHTVPEAAIVALRKALDQRPGDRRVSDPAGVAALAGQWADIICASLPTFITSRDVEAAHKTIADYVVLVLTDPGTFNGWSTRSRAPACPAPEEVEHAKREIAQEDAAAAAGSPAADEVVIAANRRRANLPSEHPDHICGMSCDGQDGMNSYCARLRSKLFK